MIEEERAEPPSSIFRAIMLRPEVSKMMERLLPVSRINVVIKIKFTKMVAYGFNKDKDSIQKG